MSKMVWDQDGERLYKTGVEQAAIFPMSKGVYGPGEAWNGLTAVNITPSGAEPTALWANNRKYGELISNEEIGGTIEAYMYPDGFAACLGEAELAPGVTVAQQARAPFGLVFKNLIGSDTEGTKHGYELTIIYNARASVSETANSTINESPEVDPMSWEFSTTPTAVEGFDPTSKITFNSTKVDADKLAALEAMIYGSESSEPKMPTPAEIIELMQTAG